MRALNEVLPYILVIIGWAQEAPKEGLLIEHRLFATEDICKAQGSEYVAQRKIYAKEFNNARFEFFCVPAPTKNDYDTSEREGRVTPSARLQAAIELLDAIIVATRDKGASADRIASAFFAARRYAGSKDRRAIRELTWSRNPPLWRTPRTCPRCLCGIGR